MGNLGSFLCHHSHESGQAEIVWHFFSKRAFLNDKLDPLLAAVIDVVAAEFDPLDIAQEDHLELGLQDAGEVWNFRSCSFRSFSVHEASHFHQNGRFFGHDPTSIAIDAEKLHRKTPFLLMPLQPLRKEQKV